MKKCNERHPRLVIVITECFAESEDQRYVVLQAISAGTELVKVRGEDLDRVL